jgi:type VI secretion system protein ImpK
MTLVELCEPMFQYICRLSRLSRKGGQAGQEEVRSQIKAMLAEMKSKAAGTPGLGAQFERVELPLIFFADSMLRESGLSFGRQWRDLAAERNELAGEDRFFDLLEETLADRSEPASERLMVYYTCLGLGFTGCYNGQPEYLRKKMSEIYARVRGKMDGEGGTQFCPGAYENVNTSDLIEPAGRSLMGIAIVLVGLIVVLFAANFVMYKSSSDELRNALDTLERQSEKVWK